MAMYLYDSVYIKLQLVGLMGKDGWFELEGPVEFFENENVVVSGVTRRFRTATMSRSTTRRLWAFTTVTRALWTTIPVSCPATPKATSLCETPRRVNISCVSTSACLKQPSSSTCWECNGVD